MLRPLLSKSLLVAASVAVTLVLAEIALRIAGIGFPALGGKLHFYRWDPHTGVALSANQEGMIHSETDIFVRTNSQGFHDIEHSKQKPPDSFRIVVLGDSFTEAMHVPIDQAFWSVMRTHLGGCAALKGKTVEAINLGASGYGTAQELQTLRHYGWDYAPDLVLLAFFSGNDVQNNHRALQEDPYRPYFVHRDGNLVLDDSFLTTPGFKEQFDTRRQFTSWALANSNVLQIVAAAKNYWSRRNVTGMRPTEMGLNDAIYHAPKDPLWQEAWSVTEDLILLMHSEVKAKGKQFMVVTLSSSIQVDADPSARQQLMRRLGVPDLFYPDQRVAQLAQRNAIPVLTLAPIFLQHVQQHKVQLHGFSRTRQGHWNAAGHELAGKLLAPKVCQILEQPAMAQ